MTASSALIGKCDLRCSRHKLWYIRSGQGLRPEHSTVSPRYVSNKVPLFAKIYESRPSHDSGCTFVTREDNNTLTPIILATWTNKTVANECLGSPLSLRPWQRSENGRSEQIC